LDVTSKNPTRSSKKKKSKSKRGTDEVAARKKPSEVDADLEGGDEKFTYDHTGTVGCCIKLENEHDLE
jgi:hypothetical protein